MMLQVNVPLPDNCAEKIKIPFPNVHSIPTLLNIFLKIIPIPFIQIFLAGPIYFVSLMEYAIYIFLLLNITSIKPTKMCRDVSPSTLVEQH